MKKYNEAEFIPRFKDGDTVKVKKTEQQGKITKVDSRENIQTGKISPTGWYDICFEGGSHGRHCEDVLELCSPKS
jgi:hypothetical protein